MLLKTIRSLSEGKQVVYFVQGDNELDFNDVKEDSIEGVGLLLANLKRNEIYDLKEWKYSKETPKLPSDANVVVAARPEKMKPEVLKALLRIHGLFLRRSEQGDNRHSQRPPRQTVRLVGDIAGKQPDGA